MRTWRLRSSWAVLCCASAVLSALGQAGGTPPAAGQPGFNGKPAAAAAVARTVRGRVVNALDGSSLSRALVTFNGRSVLSDSQGRFQFADFTDQQAFATVTKPGYSQGSDHVLGLSRQRIKDLDATIELKLYPNAIITGTVTGTDGLPLARVPIVLRRAVFEQDLRAVGVRPTQTNTRGEFRFAEPAGRFTLDVGFVGKVQETGEVVLPFQFPEKSQGGAVPYFEIAAGQQRQIDLRVRTAVAHQVPLRLEPDDGQRMAQIYAVTDTGASFPVPYGGQNPGGGWLLSLPSGTFTLHARMDNRGSVLEGMSKATVTGHVTDPIIIHMEPEATLPVEVSLDPASSQAGIAPGPFTQMFAAPNPQQLNLRLKNLDGSGMPFGNDEVPLRQKGEGAGQSYEFRVAPGHYRLQAGGGGFWYIESASYGVTNLLTGDIAIASGGGGGTPIRLVINNSMGQVSGTVRIGPEAETVWIYLVPRTPSLTVLNPFGISGSGMTNFSNRVPVGTYDILALDHRAQDDLRNAEVRAAFLPAPRTVEVGAAGLTSLDLEISREKAR